MALPQAPILKKYLPMIIAAGAAVIVVILINTYVQQKIAEDKKRLEEEERNKVNVVFAAQDIPAGSMITADKLAEQRMPREKVPPGAARSIGTVLNLITPGAINKGEAIFQNKLSAPQASRPGLATLIPVGKRAISIPVDDISSVAGMIRAGDRVDLLGVTYVPGITQEEKKSTPLSILPLFQDVLVLAFGKTTSKGKGAVNANSVTLALSPEEANILAFMQEQGKVRLVLRSTKERPAGSAVKPTDPTDWQSTIDALVPKKEEKPKRRVEIYRGRQKEIKLIEE